MDITSRYPGICYLCRDGYPAGTTITKWDHRWVHPDCRVREIERRRRTGEIVEIPKDETETVQVTRPKFKPTGRRYAATRKAEQRRQGGGRFGWGPRS